MEQIKLWFLIPSDSAKARAGRIVFLFILIDLVVSFFLGVMVHQFQEPVLQFPYVDISYWVMHLLQIPNFIASNFLIAFAFDLLILITNLLILAFPHKHKLYIFFFVLYSIYFIIFNSYGNHHAHSKVGILLLCATFCFNKKNFPLIWEGARYFVAFIFFDAFLWKLFRGSLFYSDQGSLIIKKNFTALLYYHPNHWLGICYTYLLKKPLLVNILFKVGILMEGAFVVAFFSKKWDRVLMVFLLMLPVGFLIFAEAYFFEMWILCFVFLPLSSFPVRLKEKGNPA